jgi:beta-lactam-binding protein with PASTA domain
VQLWVSKAQHGQLPNFVGSSVADVNRELRRLRLRARAAAGPGLAGTVVRQRPRPGVAVKPGLTVRLVVGDGSGR